MVALALFLYAMDQTIVATALHTLQQGLHTSVNWIGWTITIYSVAQVLVLPVAGRLSTQYGRRRVLLISVAIFACGSLGCALAGNIYVLIGMRAVQAVGGAGFTPSCTGIIVDHFGDARDRAVGMFGSIFPAGAMIGPIVGGIFVAYWSWRGIFLINVPIGVILILLCLRYVPPDPPVVRTDGVSLDVSGMLALGIGALAIMLGISYLGEKDARAGSPLFLVPAAVGIAAFVVFWRRTVRAANPFIAPRLMAGRGFGVMNVINFLWGGMSLGLGALIPLYATQRYGIGALGSGNLLTTRGIATIALSAVGAWALRRTGYRAPMYLGFVLTALGMVALAAAPTYLSAYAWLSLAAGVTGLGIGWSSPATRNAGLQLLPDQSATIAALRTMAMQAGAITFISVSTAILAASSNPGAVQALIFLVSGLVMIAALPLIVRVPEHRGAW